MRRRDSSSAVLQRIGDTARKLVDASCASGGDGHKRPTPLKLLLLLRNLGAASRMNDVDLRRRLRALVLSGSLPTSLQKAPLVAAAGFKEPIPLVPQNFHLPISSLSASSWCASSGGGIYTESSQPHHSFSKSPRWVEQRAFYLKNGLSAWHSSGGIPYQMSSNGCVRCG